jgi:hypothetical protein
MPDLRHTGLFRCDLGAPRSEELADFGAVVHPSDTTAGPGDLGCPISTPINSEFPVIGAADLLEDMTMTFRSVRRRTGAVLAIASLVTVLAGCSTDSPTVGINTTAPSPTTVVSPPSASTLRVVLRFGDEFATATLSDTPAAREFAAMLPLRLNCMTRWARPSPARCPGR